MKGIDFDVAAGEVFGLLGPNGAGKSTTVGMLTTTVAPTVGHARLAGLRRGHRPVRRPRVSAVVFQEPVVDRPLTGAATSRSMPACGASTPATRRRRIADVVEAFGLDELIDRPVATYSGGQRRRLEIARALLSEPQVLFLDEPTVGLDPRIRFELLDLIAGLRARSGMTILLTTHYLDEAEQLCDRVAIVHDGRIVALDTPAGLLAGLGQRDSSSSASTATSRPCSRPAGTRHRRRRHLRRRGHLHVPLHDRSGARRRRRHHRPRRSPPPRSPAAPTLDDVYLQLTGDRLAA